MALIFWGKSTCALCARTLNEGDPIVAFTHFLKPTHRLWRYSDAAFHQTCYETWPDRSEFEEIHDRFREIMDSRPRDLKTVEEMDRWGEEAFKDFDNG